MFVGSPRWKALTPAAQVEQLFWLYVGISAGAAGRWDDRRLTGVGRRSLHSRIDVWRADNSAALAELLAKGLVVALLFSAVLCLGLCRGRTYCR
jgi:hypothetical protein